MRAATACALSASGANEAGISEYVEDNYDVVRRKKFDVVPMSVEEAILQMNLLGHEFFVFKNTDAEDAISVVYKRRHGGYGLICDDGLDD